MVTRAVAAGRLLTPLAVIVPVFAVARARRELAET